MKFAVAHVHLDEMRIYVKFPCEGCGAEAMGNYCQNCGRKTTEFNKLFSHPVGLLTAGSILAARLEEICEEIRDQGIRDGLSESEIVVRLKDKFIDANKGGHVL